MDNEKKIYLLLDALTKNNRERLVKVIEDCSEEEYEDNHSLWNLAKLSKSELRYVISSIIMYYLREIQDEKNNKKL